MNLLFALAPALLMIGLLVYCVSKESSLTAMYRTLGIFGRVKAYLAIDFTGAGLGLFFTTVFAPLSGPVEAKSVSSAYLSIVGSVILFGLGCMLYAHSYMKCSESLKKRVVLDMTIVGWAVAVKICLFFLPKIWRLADPREVIYMPSKLREVFSGKIYTLKGTYGTYAVYNDESGYAKILDGVKERGSMFETNQGLFERVDL